MHGLVEDEMNISQGEVPIYGGDSEYGGLAVSSSWYKFVVLTPKDSGVFVLVILTKLSYQVDLISLIVPCFEVVSIMKRGDKCLI